MPAAWKICASLCSVRCSPLRLVANGCSQDEEQTLKDVCAHQERLRLYALCTLQIMEHGVALDTLQRLETSPDFAIYGKTLLEEALPTSLRVARGRVKTAGTALHEGG